MPSWWNWQTHAAQTRETVGSSPTGGTKMISMSEISPYIRDEHTICKAAIEEDLNEQALWFYRTRMSLN